MRKKELILTVVCWFFFERKMLTTVQIQIQHSEGRSVKNSMQTRTKLLIQMNRSHMTTYKTLMILQFPQCSLQSQQEHNLQPLSSTEEPQQSA